MKNILVALLLAFSIPAFAHGPHGGYHGGHHGGYRGGWVAPFVAGGVIGYGVRAYIAPPPVIYVQPRAINNYYQYPSYPTFDGDVGPRVVQINGIWYTQTFYLDPNCNCYRENLVPR